MRLHAVLLNVSLLLLSCAHSRPATFDAALDCARPRTVHTATEGMARELQSRWGQALETEFAELDAVMRGEVPAYQGFVIKNDVLHRPFLGVVKTECVDGACAQRLLARAGADALVSMAPANPRQPGHFLVHIDGEHLVCEDCIDTARTEIAFEPVLRFEERKLPLAREPSASPDEAPVNRRVEVELRRLTPKQIDLELVKRLFPRFAQGRQDAGEWVVPVASHRLMRGGPFLSFERPESVDPRFANCEAVLIGEAELRLDATCTAASRITFASDQVLRRCCEYPIYRGPPRSGHYPNPCVEFP